MKIVTFDIECDSLTPTVIWCLCAKVLGTGEKKNFIRPDQNKKAFIEFAKTVDVWIGHNVIGYDIPAIDKLIEPGLIPRDRVVDTLVLSRLDEAGREGGHSLENWGLLMRFPKGDFNDFSRFTFKMLEYCVQDVDLCERVYLKLWSRLKEDCWKKAIQIEHEAAWICQEMTENGFAFDYKTAKEIQAELQEKIQVCDREILNAFRPRSKVTEEQSVRIKKNGGVSAVGVKWYDGSLSDFTKEDKGSFCRLVWEDFNPGSPKQIVERLNEAGWKPVDKTKTHKEWVKYRVRSKEDKALRDEKLAHFKVYGWQVNETNLSTLPEDAPEGARKLVERMLLASRLRTLEEWFEAYNEHDGRIHGSYNSIGTWTHRMSHRAPNTGNIAAEKSLKYKSERLSGMAKEYGRRMRSLWCAGNDCLLVGTDAEGIQLRILAHYMDDKTFIEALINGDKEKGTDVHSMNRNLLEADSRDTAKTYIYAKCLGAGMEKQASILDCSIARAEWANEQFEKGWPKWTWLKEEFIPQDAKRGFFIGLDGRPVPCDSEHLMLAGYLQNGEAIIMKLANIKWRAELKAMGFSFKQVNFVHDEWQTELPTLDESLAKEIGRIQADAIRWAGEDLGVRCPLAGSFSVGTNWYKTH